jgi:hypothetical protein
MRRKRWHSRAATRAALIAAWAVLLMVGTVPAAHALGLPFVDLPDAGDVASDAMDSASRAIMNLIASSVASLTNEIIEVSDTVGAPQVGASNAWFTASYRRTVAVSLYLMAIASLIAITAAGIRGKVGDMAQVVFVGIPGSVIAMMLATLGVQLALSLTDAMTAYTFRSSVDDIQTFLHDIGTVFTSTEGAAQPTAALAPGLVLIIGLLVIVAQLVILAVLIIRSALIYIVTLFLPLVFAMQVWPATRHMTRKALELLAVLILSKFAIFTCFALGAGATNATLHASSGSDAVQSAIIGLGVMIAAAFSPMLLMSIIPGIAGSFGAGMPGGTAGAGALGVQTPAQIMRSMLSRVHTVRSGSSSHSQSSRSSATPRPPMPSGGSSGSVSGSARSGAAVEQAHSATNAHPAAAVAANGASVLASGAQAAASSARSATQHGSELGSGSASASSSEGPHVVGSSGGFSDSAHAPHQVSSGGTQDVESASRQATSAPSTQLALPVETEQTSNGFSRVQTRQPFTLETT